MESASFDMLPVYVIATERDLNISFMKDDCGIDTGIWQIRIPSGLGQFDPFGLEAVENRDTRLVLDNPAVHHIGDVEAELEVQG